MIARLNLARQVWSHFGPRWFGFRLGYALRRRSGLMARRLPAAEWADQPLAAFLADRQLADPDRYLAYRRSAAAPAFFFNGADRTRYQQKLVSWDQWGQPPAELAHEISRGIFRYFSHLPVRHSLPPEWNRNPLTDQRPSASEHWSKIGDFDSGDIKLIWELSRFSFVFPLVRAYWRSGDEQLAELFWQLVEDWQAKNPPQLGPNWKCGQETSFRVMAWSFGLYGFLEAAATTAQRVTRLAQMLAVSGQRIEANLDYALSQRNNHGISEGVGLWTIGLLFPELAAAGRWREQGRAVLEEQGRSLIYDDGAFVQHSFNYQRLMLHDYLWACRLGDLHGQPLSEELKARVSRSAEFLYQLQDKESGRVPNYGQNDGALVLPLSNCAYQNFRPVVQATHYLCTGQRCYPAGPWDEDLLWLFGPAAVDAPPVPVPQTNLRAEAGGYYSLRAGNSVAFVRCPVYRDRPGQADLLHLDLWWRGQNIALDPGTYSYNAPAPWNNALAHTRFHNTVTVDGLDQMERAGKFLWLPWAKGRVTFNRRSAEGQLHYWEGEHNGYQRLANPVTHRRGIVRLGPDTWLVLDRLDSRAGHRYRLHWLLVDAPYDWERPHLTLQTSQGPYYVQLGANATAVDFSLIRADDASPRGWQAPYYYHKQPALSLAADAQGDTIFFWSLFSAQPCQVEQEQARLCISSRPESWQARLELQNDIYRPLITTIRLTGDVADNWEIR